MSETQVSNRYCVRADEVADYHPANHTGTLNCRLIGPETVGATQLEVLVIYAPPYGESPDKVVKARQA